LDTRMGSTLCSFLSPETVAIARMPAATPMMRTTLGKCGPPIGSYCPTMPWWISSSPSFR
jgi:hypothetical protein